MFKLEAAKSIISELLCLQTVTYIHKHFDIHVLGPLCYKLITIVNCYLETGFTCFVYCPKALYLFIFIVWLLL